MPDAPVPPVGPWPANPVLRSIRHTRQFIAISACISLLGLVVACLTSNTNWTIFWGMLCAAGVTLIFVGLVTVSTYHKLLARVESMFSENQLIGRWSCTPEEWSRHISRERTLLKKSLKGVRWVGLLVIPGLAVMIFELFTGGKPQPISEWFTLFGIGVAPGIAAYFLFYTFPIWFRIRLLRRSTDRDTYIGPGGVIIGGIFWSWETYGARLILIHHDKGDPGMILFRWGQPTGTIYAMTQEVRAPLPQSHDAEATHVITAFGKIFTYLKPEVQRN